MDGNPDDNFSLSSVFSESYFVIPDYQRDYAWETANVEDLLEDIEFVYGQNENTDQTEKVNHYFGTIVLEERGTIEPTEFEDYDQLGIVDGQQRITTVVIIVSTIIDELDRIASNVDIDDKMREDIQEKKGNILEGYLRYEGIPRLRLGGLAQEAYDKVILGNTDVEEYASKTDLVEAERKVLNAKQATKSQLQEWKAEKCSEVAENKEASYYKFLKNIVRIITKRFEVNIKIVKDVDEAARMFKVINNRGRGLCLHDKIRSHLVYCASQSDELESEEIYRIFNNIVENVTIHDGFSDAEVDNLVKLHWAVFTSERSDSRAKREGPVDIHKRLSDLDDYASIQRDDYEAFIRPYIKSLESFSEQYPYLSDRDKFAKRYSDSDNYNIDDDVMEDTIRKIQSLYIHTAARRATTPLLISVAEKFSVDSREFAEVVSELEKLVFRYSLCMSNGAQGFKGSLWSIANDLYWSDISDNKARIVFNSDSERYLGYKSKELGIQEVKRRISEKRERIAPIDETISEYLSSDDILEGEFTSGWGGIRNNETIKYLMYEYERSLRDQSGEISLAPYYEVRDDFEVEHLVPKNAEAGHKLTNHKQKRNRIGNLAILSSGDNKSNGNNSYKQKYEEVYRKSSLKVLRTLDSSDFTISDINQREEEEIFPFIRERWG
ncbi:DUF262 domain-containing protein [Natrialbaceae archaeon A-gly3]